MTPEQARQVLEEEEKARLEECRAQVEMLCEQFQCVIVPRIVLMGSQIVESGIAYLSKPNAA